MKIPLTATLCALAVTSPLFAGGEGWSSDFKASQKTASEEKKDLLIDFTGSDWCGWCIRLNKEVFSKDEFKNGVKDKFVLLEIDFPKDASKLSEETKKQNTELGKEFNIEGYPTIVLADASGKPYATTGYEEGGAANYVKHLDELRERKTKRDEAFAAAATLEGVPKATKLVAALKEMNLENSMLDHFYSEEIGQIKAADPKDETGFIRSVSASQRFGKMQEQLQQFGAKKDHKGALELVETTIKEGGYTKEQTQELILMKASILAAMERFDEAIKTVEEAVTFWPESPINKQIENFKKRMVTARDAKELESTSSKEAPKPQEEKASE